MIFTVRSCDSHMTAKSFDGSHKSCDSHMIVTCHSTLPQAQFCSDLPVSDLLGVKECEAELLEPQGVSHEDFIKFVSSLALSVHVEAALKNAGDPTSIAVLVRGPGCPKGWGLGCGKFAGIMCMVTAMAAY